MLRRADIGYPEKLILLYLLDRQGQSTTPIPVMGSEMASGLGISERVVWRAISRLRSMGLITRSQQIKNRWGRGSNLYTVQLAGD